ncbi:MAG: SGNH/GDSL hydrolase family protein [Alistipes sp.]|nr:SGNH/GDSL hydrolase family protein [Alistipes sp.]
MKKLFLSLVAIVALVASSSAAEKGEGNLKFVDATTLNICGHTMRTEKSPYFRFDCEPYNFKEEAIRRYSRYSSGMYVVFRTNSSQVSATWENVKRRCGDNMTPIFQWGLDLYIKDGGEWRFCGVGRVSTDPEKNCRTRSLIKNLPEGEKEFMLYLPYWCELTRLEIGVDKDATIEAIPSPFRHKVVVYGSSITHGASASRPGMAYPARMSRSLGIDFVNFGFSGNCKMQPEFIPFMTKVEADAFVCDAFANPTAEQIAERVEPFIDAMVAAHPGKPIIMLRTFHHESEFYDQERREAFIRKCDIAREKMKMLTKKYKDVYYLEEPYATGNDCESTIDTSHPNDIGFDRIIKTYQPKIAKILRKYGIK